MALWKGMGLWKKEDKGYKLETSKKGENYFVVLKVDDEVVMTIISPPTGFNIDTTIGVEGGASAISASGGVNVSRDKAATYGKPIVLFNKDNKAGLQIQDILTDVKTKLIEVDPEREKSKIDPNILNQDNVEIINEKSVTIGSTIVDIQKEEVVLMIKSGDTIPIYLTNGKRRKTGQISP